MLNSNNPIILRMCAVEVKNCSLHEPRRLDYSCNNVHYPSRGTSFTPFYRLLPPVYSTNGGLPTTKAGTPLPNARALRVALVPDGRVPSEKHTHLLTNMFAAITSDTTSVHDAANYVLVTRTCCLPGGQLDPRCMPIRIPDDDVHLRRSNVRCMNLTRQITYQRLGCVPDTIPPARMSLTTPMIDLSIVYGAEEATMNSGRERWGGRLIAEKLKGKDWPRGDGTICLQNNLNETRCHNSPSMFVNSLLSTNLFNLWFMRQHNYMAEKLAKLNPCWDDDKLFAVTRDINIAIWQHIMYYDLMPNVVDGIGSLGHDPPRGPSADWWVLTTADAAGTNGLTCLPKHGEARNSIMGERAVGRLQTAFDVVAVDIMKARDNGLPSYNRYRELCKLPVAHDFEDFYKWLPKDQAEAIQMLYEDVDDVEVMAGLLAERPMGAGVVGPTHACIIADQMLRWRRADRFWYEHSAHPAALTPAPNRYCWAQTFLMDGIGRLSHDPLRGAICRLASAKRLQYAAEQSMAQVVSGVRLRSFEVKQL
ncbi:hypothetical protein evm_013928 [Chilo suppressalis]|nr:hypothetical protein evm_013928 [Chilo suppressalis]